MSWIQLEGGGGGGGGEGEWQPEATWFQEPDPSAPTFAQYLPQLQTLHTLQTHLANLCNIPDIAFNYSIRDTEQVSHLGGGSEGACRQVRRVEQLRGVSPHRTVPVVPPRVIGWNRLVLECGAGDAWSARGAGVLEPVPSPSILVRCSNLRVQKSDRDTSPSILVRC